MDEAGAFPKIPRIDDSRLAEIFTKTEAEGVCKYMIRPLLSLERLSFSEKEGQVCYRYGKGAREVIAFLTDYAVVDRIIDHLKLTFVAERPPPAHLAYQEVLMAAESSAEYFS